MDYFCFKLKASLFRREEEIFGKLSCYIFLHWAAQFQFCKYTDLCSAPKSALGLRPHQPWEEAAQRHQHHVAAGCRGTQQKGHEEWAGALASSPALLPAPIIAGRRQSVLAAWTQATCSEKRNLDRSGWREPSCH